ncbi:MAG: ABC transporter substrate-binding protein [Firmicutes bacterium]|nr:ABC transporter substrate-binding protein [Bacillota bacterium]
MKKKLFKNGRRKILTVSALAVTALLSLGLAGCGGSADSGDGEAAEGGITAGGLWALTGFMDSYEVAGSEGFELALEQINAEGGIDGQEVGYVKYDSESDAEKATSLISKLIENDGADVIFGMGDPNAAIAAGTVAQDAGVPTLATSSTLPYTQDRVGDTAFLVPYGDNIQAAAIAEYAYNDLGVRSAYVVTDTTDEYTLSLSKYFQSHFQTLGGKILGETTYDDNGYTDFSASIQKIKKLDEQPDALFFASFTDQGPTMLKQYREAGLDQVVLSGDGLDSVEVAQTAGEAANNTYFSTHVDYSADNAAVKDFLEAYQEKYGKEPDNAFAALGYDAAYLLKYAVENYGNGDYSPAAIRDAIAQVTDFEGITGNIDYSGGNVPNKTVFICEFKDGDKENLASLVPTFTEEELAADTAE